MGPAARVIGSVFSGRYRLTRKLGEGGVGEVFAGEALDGGPAVALKVLRGEYFGDAVVRSRFVDEAQTGARLVHPNIVRVFSCAETEDGLPYMVMELLEGVPLGAYMRDGARLPVAQAVPILQGVLAGLAVAHAHAVVHRDLKPDNVFLTRDPSGRFVVKVLDFGIAKVMDAAGGMGTRTRSGMFLGTPAYMSPEQARNARDVDQRADLWSAGVLLYEMLTGQAAFPAPTELARLAALVTDEPRPIAQIDPTLGPVASVVERAMKKDREQRFSSALEMSQALTDALGGRPKPIDPPPGPGDANVSPRSDGTDVGATMPSAARPPATRQQATLASPPAMSVDDPVAQVDVLVPALPPLAPIAPARPFAETLESQPPAKDESRGSRSSRPNEGLSRRSDAPLDAQSVSSRSRTTQGIGQGAVAALVVTAFIAGILVGWLAARVI
jgi:serine/threonine-protein kinase